MRCFHLNFSPPPTCHSATCFSWPTKVVVIGDTITIPNNNQQKEISLYGIDCQEQVSCEHERWQDLQELGQVIKLAKAMETTMKTMINTKFSINSHARTRKL